MPTEAAASVKRDRRANFRWSDVFLVFFIVVAIVCGTHVWLNDRLAVFRAIYPVQAQLTKWSGKCSAAAPAWMRETLNQATSLLTSPANQLAYISPDGELHHCENGWRTAMFRSPLVDNSTRYRYASVSKLFTADAVLALMAREQLSLDTPLLELFPELPAPQDSRVAQITISQLLTHQAGFDRLQSEDPVFKHHHKSWCPHDLSELSRLRLDFMPGERQAYSNRGYCLLGQVVERLSGQDFRSFLRAQYGFDSRGVRFSDGPYLKDEVRYDFRNSDFYGSNYSRFFDFDTLSAVAGLTGSATALVQVTAEILQREDLNLLSAQIDQDCDQRSLQHCYGYSFYHYRPSKNFTFYINEGFLPGTLPILVADSKGGILALLPSGTPHPRVRSANKKKLIDNIYSKLIEHYHHQ